MTFEELCCKYPKVAIEKISNDYKIYCEKAPKIGKCWNSQVDLRQPGKRESSNQKRNRALFEMKDAQTMSVFFSSYKTIHRTSWKWDSIVNEWGRWWKLIPTFFLSCYSSVLNNAHLSSLKFPGVRDLWEEVCWGTFFGRAPVRERGKQD